MIWTGDVQPGATGIYPFTARLPEERRSVTFQGEESYTNLPDTGLFPFVVALQPGPVPSTGRAGRETAALIAAAAIGLAGIGAAVVYARRRATHGR